MSDFSDVTNKLTGNIAKAELWFFEPIKIIRKIIVGTKDDKGNFVKNDDLSFSQSQSIGKLSTNEASEKLGAAIAGKAQEGQLMKYAGEEVKYSSVKKKTLEVQFNPTTLKITARGGGRTLIGNISNDGTSEENSQARKNAYSYQRMNPYMDISFKLIFDQEINNDAFFRDRYTFNISNVARSGASAINKLKGEEYSVQPIIEGFVGAVRSNYHRMVAISWGSMFYKGMLNQVDARYTMFSPSGNPIRGEVSINLYCSNMDKSGNNWAEKYRNAVGDKTAGAQSRPRVMVEGAKYEAYQNVTSYLSNFLGL